VGFAQKLDDFFDRELLKRLAETIQGFVELDRGVLHALVGVFGTAQQNEMLCPRDPMLSVVVETYAEKSDDLTLILLGFRGHRAAPFPK
jgi:hypothetical protein